MSTTPPFRVLDSRRVFTGRVMSLRSDTLTMPGGGTAVRDLVEHPGAVGVVALRGAPGAEEVVLVRQYRHPVGRELWELPAGLLDVADEPGSVTGARELAEETGLRAATWHHLLDLLTSPGGSDEAVRLLLARDITEIPHAERHAGQDEEAAMTVAWVGLDEAVEQVLDGRITNALAVAGLLAAAAVRARGFTGLHPAGSWPDRPAHSG